MSEPIRIQLSRKKGFKLPPNTVVVARPTKWGNPFKVEADGTADICVKRYRNLINANIWTFPNKTVIHEELRGKNLGCWCPISEPCHADVLLEIANKKQL